MIPTQSNPPQNRGETVRFLVGQSGNPGGRPVGFHNYIQERTADGSEWWGQRAEGRGVFDFFTEILLPDTVEQAPI